MARKTSRKRKKTSQAKRGETRIMPYIIWGVMGALIGLALAFYLVSRDDWPLKNKTNKPVPNVSQDATRVDSEPVAQLPRQAPPKPAPAKAPEPKPKQDEYEFYTLLTEEKPVTDADLSAQVRREQQKPASQTQPASQPPSSGSYLLQVGAYRTTKDAEQIKAKLAFQGMQARIETANVNGITWHRVRLGPFNRASDLDRAKQQLLNAGHKAMAIRVK